MNTYDRCITIIIIIISLIRISIDMTIKYKNCFYKKDVSFILFLHSFIWVFTYLGCLYTDKKILYIYLTTIFIIMLHWLTNKNKCIMTTFVNEKCNLHIDTTYDWLYVSNNGWVICVLAKLFCLLYAIQKIIK